MLTYEQIMKRVKKSRETREIWNQHFRECYRYTIPERQTFDNFSPGQKKREWVFDSTPVEALEDYANRMESQVTPAWRNWAKLDVGAEIPEDQEETIQQYLEEASDVLFHNIKHSNFNSQIHEAYLDLGISTGAIIVEEGDGISSALSYRAISLSEILLEKQDNGRPETVYRDFMLPVKEIMEVFPYAKLTSELTKMLTETPEKEVSLTEGIIKVKGGFEQILIWDKESEFLYQAERKDSPWIIFRESTIPQEAYGRGRVMRALPDIKTLNKMVEDHLRAASFTSNPIYTMMSDGVLNPYTARLKPGSIMPVESNDRGNPSIAPLPQAGNYNVLQYDIRALQDSIRQMMMSKPYGNIEETPVRTALEMSIRQADSQATTSASGGRIQTELLEPLISKSVDILVKAGKIAPLKVDGKQVTIKYTSPAARQQDSDDISNTLQFLNYLTALPPQVAMSSVKMEEVPDYLAEKMGISKKLIRSETERTQIAAKTAQLVQDNQGQVPQQQGQQ